MSKKVSFRTVSLGTDPPLPEADVLARWVSKNRGRQADLVTFLLENGLDPQIDADIYDICTGGRFYGIRCRECLTGIKGNHVIGEMGFLPNPVTNDAAEIGKCARGARMALPAPHILGLKDAYFGDDLEMQYVLSVQYRHLMRAMRDSGIAGHVLHCDQLFENELEMLAGKKVFFYLENPDSDGIATLLEYQGTLAVAPEKIPLVEGLMNEYDISRIILVNPDREALIRILHTFDPDKVSAGGYCTSGCSHYWKGLVGSSTIMR